MILNKKIIIVFILGAITGIVLTHSIPYADAINPSIAALQDAITSIQTSLGLVQNEVNTMETGCTTGKVISGFNSDGTPVCVDKGSASTLTAVRYPFSVGGYGVDINNDAGWYQTYHYDCEGNGIITDVSVKTNTGYISWSVTEGGVGSESFTLQALGNGVLPSSGSFAYTCMKVAP